MWTKPIVPSVHDWPMREELHDLATRVGRIWIRKEAYNRCERGVTSFLARGYLRVKDAGPGLIDIGGGQEVAPMSLQMGTPFINVRVEYTYTGEWMWSTDRAMDSLKCRTYPRCIWVV